MSCSNGAGLLYQSHRIHYVIVRKHILQRPGFARQKNLNIKESERSVLEVVNVNTLNQMKNRVIDSGY